jgi:hypothetical protein
LWIIRKRSVSNWNNWKKLAAARCPRTPNGRSSVRRLDKNPRNFQTFCNDSRFEGCKRGAWPLGVRPAALPGFSQCTAAEASKGQSSRLTGENIMKAILSSIAVAAALVAGAARAQNTDAANPPAADPAAMKAALARAAARGEISPGEAAEMANMADLLRAERKAAEIRDRLRAIEDLEDRAAARQR